MNSLTNIKEKRASGFTLLELLIVISIIAILSIALVFMLNPAETLKKGRDAQRISDLKTLKTSLGLMLTSTSTPSLDGTFGAATSVVCLTKGDGTAQTGKVAYSAYPAPTSGITTTAGSDSSGTAFAVSGYTAASQAAAGKVDGTGWIPVSFKALTGGSPLSNLPVDPVNTVSAAASASDLVYRYACQNGSLVAGKPSFIFEVDAVLESSAYTVDDNKMAKDGGDYATMYETGNTLNLLPASGNF